MARGKTKLRKGERAAAKAAPWENLPKAASAAAASAAAAGAAAAGLSATIDTAANKSPSSGMPYDSLDASPGGFRYAHHDGHENGPETCDHANLDPARMKKVGQLLSDLFSSSFQLAVPSLFRGMVQNLQDQVLKDKLMSFVDHGFSPSLINTMAGDSSTQEGIKMQIQLACEEELGDVVLRLSTEDCFDLLCDLAVRHGRDLKTWGPPCACSFSHCLPCLERLVNSVRTTPGTQPAEIKPVNPHDLHLWVEDLVRNEWVDQQWTQSGNDWKRRMTDAWEIMAKILWDTACAIDPLKLPKVVEAHDTLRRLDGVELWYIIVARELEASSSAPKKSSAYPTIADLTTKVTSAVSAVASGKKKEVSNGKGKEVAGRTGDAGDAARVADEEWMGSEHRKNLARTIREQGNTAYAASQFLEATEHYTRAIGYDSTEPIYPLNRAACLLKLKRFEEAERDCTAALILNPDNHKAYFRRGVSRAGMGKCPEAREDFEEVLRLQRGNASAYEELRKLSQQFLAEAASAAGRKRAAQDADAVVGLTPVPAVPLPPGAVERKAKAKGPNHLTLPDEVPGQLEPPHSAGARSASGEEAESEDGTNRTTEDSRPHSDAATDDTSHGEPGGGAGGGARAKDDVMWAMREQVAQQIQFAYLFSQLVAHRAGVENLPSLIGFRMDEEVDDPSSDETGADAGRGGKDGAAPKLEAKARSTSTTNSEEEDMAFLADLMRRKDEHGQRIRNFCRRQQLRAEETRGSG